MNKILETERLILAEVKESDVDNIYEIISDKETMKFYKKPYDYNGAIRWINWCINSYKENGFSLFSVFKKDNNEYIGDCGISLQNIDNNIVHEIGYHIRKEYHNMGYGSEASLAIRNWFFDNFNFDRVYSYMNKDNISSYTLAIKNFMTLDKMYDNDGEIERVYSIKKETYNLLNEYNSGEFVYRKARNSDIDKILKFAKIMEKYYPSINYNEYKNKCLKLMESGRINACFYNGNVVGYLMFSRKLNKICFLLVLDEFQNKGIGTKLINISISELDRTKDIIVYTYNDNDEKTIKSHNFYKKLGFIEDGIVEEFGTKETVYKLKGFNYGKRI